VAAPEGKEEFPSQFARYSLVERLATGGMAEVFKAKILSTHGFEKLLVIKRILPHLAADKTFVAMFIDEAKLTAQLVHPKIVQVTDFGEVNGQYFIALEYVDGFDALALLRASAQRQVRLPVPLCMFIAMEVLDALDYAHNAKHADGKPMRIVHRDISPSNVFISRRGDVKLGDFGIAHAQERESKTQAGTLKGKYGYMSPEQVVGGSLDARSDLFAVGIVLAEMIMGRRLFSAPNDLDVLLMVRDGKLDRLDKYCRDLPGELDEVLRKSLRRRASERYQTAAEFRDALADLLFRMGFRVGPSDVGRIASDYFDPSPDAVGRLNEHARRLRVRAPTAVYPAVTGGEVVTPAPGGNSQKFEWGVAPSPGAATISPSAMAPHSPTPPPSAVAERGSSISAEVDVIIEDEPPGAPTPSAGDASVLAALDQALSQPLAVVDLDQYSAPSSSAGMAVSPGPPSPMASRAAGSGRYPPAMAMAVAVPSGPAPDTSGDLTVLSPTRVLADLAVGAETGLVRFELDAIVKDVYLVRGAPESFASNQPADGLGDYLVARGFLRPADLERATAQSGRQGGRLADSLVAIGAFKPVDIFRLQAQHVRERTLELVGWGQGVASFFRGQRNPVESPALGLDCFEIIGAGVLTLPPEFLQSRLGALAEFRPRAVPNPRVHPESFRLGGKPRELWSALDGRRTVRELQGRFTNAADVLTFTRMLYLLVETDLARLE
jgi:serine/threonine protein kinase